MIRDKTIFLQKKGVDKIEMIIKRDSAGSENVKKGVNPREGSFLPTSSMGVPLPPSPRYSMQDTAHMLIGSFLRDRKQHVISFVKQGMAKPRQNCATGTYKTVHIWVRSPPWLYKSYCLSDMQICYQLGKMGLSFYQPASI